MILSPGKDSHLVMCDAETDENVVVVISDAAGDEFVVLRFAHIRDADAMFRCLLDDIGFDPEGDGV